MKNFIKILLPLLVVIGVFYTGYRIIQISINKRANKEKIAHIPAFEVKTLDGNFFSNNDLKQNLPVVILYFNSDCDFCQAETNEIVANIKKLKGAQIIFVSNEPVPQIMEFQKKYLLDNYDNVIFLCDYNNKFAELFSLKTIPTSLIYSKEGVLLNKNDGPVKVDYLLKNIK